MPKRKIIRIDEEKCDGCGLCVPACAEGAIQVIDGKARLVSDVYCDGFGDCLGECPQGAITIVDREAEAFDEQAVKRHLADQAEKRVFGDRHTAAEPEPPPSGCPGMLARMFQRPLAAHPPASDAPDAHAPSRLVNWPIQLNLVPVIAPYFQGARLLIAADCVPCAFADFHERFLAGKTLLIGCPKLDNVGHYREKMAQILRGNDIQSVEVLHMEVPCCFGLVQAVRLALRDSGKEIPLAITRIGLRGEICETSTSQGASAQAHLGAKERS